jgi:hypothetical protein
MTRKVDSPKSSENSFHEKAGSIEPIIFSTAAPDQSHVASMGHDHFVP